MEAYEAGAGEAEKEGYQRAYDAFMQDHVLPSAVGVLRENGVDCEITDNGPAFFATAAQLEGLAFKDLPNWYFDRIK